MSRPIAVATNGYLTGNGGVVLSSAVDGYLVTAVIPVPRPSGGGMWGGGYYEPEEHKERRDSMEIIRRDDDEVAMIMATVFMFIKR